MTIHFEALVTTCDAFLQTRHDDDDEDGDDDDEDDDDDDDGDGLTDLLKSEVCHTFITRHLSGSHMPRNRLLRKERIELLVC